MNVLQQYDDLVTLRQAGTMIYALVRDYGCNF